MAEFPHEDAELGSVLALAAVVAARSARIGDQSQSAAFLQAHLTGTLSFREPAAVFAAPPKNIPGDGGGAHFHRAKAGTPISIETIPGDVPRIASANVEAVALVPFDA